MNTELLLIVTPVAIITIVGFGMGYLVALAHRLSKEMDQRPTREAHDMLMKAHNQACNEVYALEAELQRLEAQFQQAPGAGGTNVVFLKDGTPAGPAVGAPTNWRPPSPTGGTHNQDA